LIPYFGPTINLFDAQGIPLVGPPVLDGRHYPVPKNLLILSLILTYSVFPKVANIYHDPSRDDKKYSLREGRIKVLDRLK